MEVKNLYYRTKKRPKAMEHKELYKEGKEVFGSWTKMMQAAGISEIIQRETLQELKEFMAKNGRPPKRNDEGAGKELYMKAVASFQSLKNALIVLQGHKENDHVERPSCALPPSYNCSAQPKLVKGHSFCCEACDKRDCLDRCSNSSDRCKAYQLLIIK